MENARYYMVTLYYKKYNIVHIRAFDSIYDAVENYRALENALFGGIPKEFRMYEDCYIMLEMATGLIKPKKIDISIEEIEKIERGIIR